MQKEKVLANKNTKERFAKQSEKKFLVLMLKCTSFLVSLNWPLTNRSQSQQRHFLMQGKDSPTPTPKFTKMAARLTTKHTFGSSFMQFPKISIQFPKNAIQLLNELEQQQTNRSSHLHLVVFLQELLCLVVVDAVLRVDGLHSLRVLEKAATDHLLFRIGLALDLLLKLRQYLILLVECGSLLAKQLDGYSQKAYRLSEGLDWVSDSLLATAPSWRSPPPPPPRTHDLEASKWVVSVGGH